MAIKRSTRKTSGGAKMTTTYNTKTGRTRVTHTVKPTKSLTISRSRNNNGTIKTTTTNTINGWMSRSTKTKGTGVVKPRRMKTPKSSFNGSSRRSRSSSGGDGGILIALVFAAIAGLFWIAWKVSVALTVGLWSAAKASVKEPGPEVEEAKPLIMYVCKVIGLFLLYVWLVALMIYGSYKLLTMNSENKPPIIPASVETLNLDKPIAVDSMQYRGQDGPIGPIQLSE